MKEIEVQEDKLTSLMKKKYGVTKVSKLNRTSKDTLYTFLKKTAKYIYNNGEWDEILDVVEASKKMLPCLRSDLRNASYLESISNTEELSSLFPEETAYAGENIKIIIATGLKNEVNDKEYYLLVANLPKFRNVQSTFHYYRSRKNVVYTCMTPDLVIGYSVLKENITRDLRLRMQAEDRDKYNFILNQVFHCLFSDTRRYKKIKWFDAVMDVRELIQLYRIEYNDFVSSNAKMIDDGIPDVSFTITKAESYIHQLFSNLDFSIGLVDIVNVLDYIDDYLMDIKGVVQQQNEELSINRIVRASAWDEKKNINKSTKHTMYTSSLLKHFIHLELDDEIDSDKFSRFENEVNTAFSFLPKLHARATLRLRKLRNYHSLGIYVPRLNTIVIDPREGSDYIKMERPGITTFIHEYGLALDYSTILSRPLSMSTEFNPFVNAVTEKFNQNQSKFTAKEIEFFTIPSEIFARLFEMYIASCGYKGSLLLDWEQYKKNPVYKLTAQLNNGYNTFWNKVQNFFEKKYPDIKTNIQQLHSNRVVSYPIKTKTQENNNKQYRYYSTLRPIDQGTYPQKPSHLHNFGKRIEVTEGLKAWGYLDYEHPLTKEEAYDYDLVLASIKADIHVTKR